MDSMMGTFTMMITCMIASTLFALAIGVSVIVQAVLQVKILREIRKLNTNLNAGGSDRIRTL